MNLLVATDFSDNSKAALRWGGFLANQLGSDLTVIHVVDLAAGDNAWRVLVETPEEIERSAVIEAQEKLERFCEETLDDMPDAINYRAVLGNPIDELLDEADKVDDPIILAGARGESRLREFFLGNTARRLVRQSEYPVILVPPEAEVAKPQKLVVGVDFSDPSKEAIRRAAVMARTYEASVHLVYGYVLPEVATFEGSMATVSSDYDDLIEDKRKSLEKVVVELGADDVVTEVTALHQPPAAAIVGTAEDEGGQFIFVGSHGRRGVKRFFLGNTAERVMRNAPCPIFVVRPGQLDGNRQQKIDESDE